MGIKLIHPAIGTGDANGDGVASSSDDEFVEIVNATGISGWTIALGVRHVVSVASSVLKVGTKMKF
ncbi:MAG: hypothetical protein H6554_04100 [Chitinophagales bacterium]|nr:hypothetical protein [Chitinophagales bacterium]